MHTTSSSVPCGEEITLPSGVDCGADHRFVEAVFQAASRLFREPSVKGSSCDRACLASDWNPLSRDEDVRYYLKQLEDAAKLFDEFTPGRSRQGVLL